MALINQNMSANGIPTVLKYVVIIAGLLILFSLLNPFVVINAGHRGVKTTFGKVKQVVFEEGPVSYTHLDVYKRQIIKGATVKATVLSHGRGDKVMIFKFRRRKHYRKTQGHRQSFTEIKIEAIAAK